MAGRMDLANGERNRSHFDDFWWSTVTVFQVMGGENWNEVFAVAYDNVGPFTATFYFVSLFVLGNYVMLNLFLAILLSNFEESNQEEKDDIAAKFEDSMISKTVLAESIAPAEKQKQRQKRSRNSRTFARSNLVRVTSMFSFIFLFGCLFNFLI